jgi:adenylate cyclase
MATTAYTETSLFVKRAARSPLLVPLVVAAVAWAMALAFEFVPFLQTIEFKTLDSRFVASAHPELADTSVVIVTIDQNSLDFYERQQVGWPWPREFYALLLEYLRVGGAKTVAFDIDFSSRSPDRLEVDGEASDAAFADAIRASGNVILPAFLSSRESQDQEGDSLLQSLVIPYPRGGRPSGVLDRATAPRREFQEAIARLCIANFESDRDDIARRATMQFPFRTGRIPHFALACFMDSRGVKQGKIDSVLQHIPMDAEGRLRIYWYGKGGPGGAFRYYSIHALIHSARKIKVGAKPDLPPEVFHNKHVIVGGSAQGLYDYKPTPFTALEPYPGMDIHATILSNLLQEHYITTPGPWANSLVGLAFGVLIVLLFRRQPRVSVAVIVIVAAVSVYFLIAWSAFNFARLWLPVAGPGSSAVLAFALTAVVSYATEGRQKRKLRRAFGRYVSPHVVTEILEHADALDLGGRTIEGTVYFSDIKDFTSIAERYAPKDLVALLNEYFSLASDIILKNEAMLDKYIGDAVMAIFGAPVPRPDSAKVACLTALEVQRLLDAHYADAQAQGIPRFVTRIGLNSGKMIVGNIGHAQRLDYTVIGDTVNLASRLEGVNKAFGTRIIIGETTYAQARDAIEARELDLIRVKGKAQAIRIYELLAATGTLPADKRAVVEMFLDGLGLYRQRRFTEADARFHEVLRLDPNDGPARTYIDRCAELKGATLPEDWDGVYTMHTK